MKKIIGVIACCLLMLSFYAYSQKNLVLNGGFEDELLGWNPGNSKVTTWVYKSGKASLAIVSYLRGKWQGVDQKVKLPKNTKGIQLSGAYKTDDVEQGANTWNVAVILIEFLNGDKKLGEAIPIVEKTGTNAWTTFDKKVAVPASATDFRIMIALSEASGTLFADDINVHVLTEKELADVQE